MLGFWYNDLTRAQEGFKVTLVEPWDSYIYYVFGLAGFSSYLVSRLAGTNCIFIWHEARDEGGMRGTYLPLIPRPPPRPNLGRPVWRACCPRDHLGLEGKRLQLQPRSPWGVGVACRSLQATLSLELGLFQFKPRMSPHQREGEDTWQVHWYVCPLGLLFGHPWTRYYMSYKNVVNTTQQVNTRSNKNAKFFWRKPFSVETPSLGEKLFLGRTHFWGEALFGEKPFSGDISL